MKHLSGWKTVTAAATTAAVAAGAFGIATVISDDTDDPVAIEIAAEQELGEPVTAERERLTSASSTSVPSVDDRSASFPTSPSMASTDSASDATTTASTSGQTEPAPAPRIIESASVSSISPDSPSSPPSPPSPDSPPSPPSPESPDSPDSPESATSIDEINSVSSD